MIKVDAACVDAGDGEVFDVVLKFCGARLARKIFAIKGFAGFGRPVIQASKSKRLGGRLFIVGSDVAKTSLFNRLARPGQIRFSSTLEGEYFAQLASEVKKVRDTRGKPVVRFERKPGARAEALDCCNYAIAAKAMLQLNLDEREAELRETKPATPKQPEVYRSKWLTTVACSPSGA